MLIKKKKGQSTVEYIVLVTAVVSVLIVFLMSDASPFKQRVNDTYLAATDGMVNMAQRLNGTFTASPN